jgi:hypothetical protein
MASFCGHSYGGGTLQRVYDTVQCNFLITNFTVISEICCEARVMVLFHRRHLCVAPLVVDNSLSFNI